jgi:Cdc6-like AAA superfamily ATPase
MSKCIVIVGATGTGKTTKVCELLNEIRAANKDRPNVIFDVNNEEKYKQFRNHWDKNFDFKKFVDNATKRKDTNIVFEEATIFFSHAGNTENIKTLLVQKRHTRNILIFNFHSLRQVPLFILDFCDFLIIGKTIDNFGNIEKKFSQFPSIFLAFCEVMEITKQDKYFKRIVKLN